MPVPGKTINVSAVQVSLSGATLPNATVGSAYTYDFSPNLVVAGDPSYTGFGVKWSIVAGALPAGVTLTSGQLTGTPTAAGNASFTAAASYLGKSSQANYSMQVNSAAMPIVLQAGGYRTWSDGSVAASCNDYLHPVAPKVYTGSTGDGVYRTQPVGQAATDVKCDMTTDDGGWTLVVGAASTNRAHIATGAVAWSALTLAAPKGKYADAFINAVNAQSTGAIGYRVESNGVKSYFPATCTFAATTTASSACATYTQTYAATPTWITGASTSDGCGTPTYYTALSSAKHAACNGAVVAADNGGVIYGRLGNTNTNGMVTVKTTGYTMGVDGAVWVR